MPKRQSKYRNIPTVVDGIKFDSKKEARRYGELLLLKKDNAIKNLILQPPFVLKVDGQKICSYIGDFQYEYNGRVIVEDCKGYRTRDYVIKKKLMKAIFGIEIRES